MHRQIELKIKNNKQKNKMINFRWVFKPAECYIQNGELNKVVAKVEWMLAGIKEVNKQNFTVIKSGAIELGEPDAASFIEFEKITEATVINWIESTVNVAQLKSDIEDELNQKSNPNLVKITLPFYLKK